MTVMLRLRGSGPETRLPFHDFIELNGGTHPDLEPDVFFHASLREPAVAEHCSPDYQEMSDCDLSEPDAGTDNQ